MRHLFVWMRRGTGALSLAGELAVTEPDRSNGRFESEFEYATDWVRGPDAFAIDPVSLPLEGRGQRFRAELFYPPLAVFDDALPDDWGRRLLAMALKLERREPSQAEMLLRMRGGGTGALVFTEEPVPPEPHASVQSTALPALLTAATKFEAGTLPPDDAFRQLLEGSSPAGGARPKALVHDNEAEWVAKFPSRARDAGYDVVGLEATCLELARRAGLQAPESRLQTVGRRRVLLVRRFDVTEQGGRVHMVSMRTLCKERPGIYVQDYAALAQVLRKHSALPSVDVEALFRYMVFNAAIGNVDDHLKNFWMLGTPSGYRLAPAFDLVPDVTGRGQHTLSFQYGFACPTRAELAAVGDAWGVSQAAEIMDEVAETANAFPATARKLKVRGGKTLEIVQADVRRRLNLISTR